MLEALIVTLREGVEAALVIGIAVAYLNKAGRGGLVRWVYAGLVAALIGSVGLGLAFAKFKWNQDRFEGYVMLAAGAGWSLVNAGLLQWLYVDRAPSRLLLALHDFALLGAALCGALVAPSV